MTTARDDDARAALRRLESGAELESGAGLDPVLAVFDTLPPVSIERMRGRWRGSELATGHPMDGLLDRMGWLGKRFGADGRAHPLVFAGAHGPFAVDPQLVPFGLAVRFPAVVRHPVAQRLTTALLPTLRTARPAARLRMTRYRGVVSATMTYDRLPIDDHFRRIDDDTLLGVMELRGTPPFPFVLRRERGQDSTA